MYQPHAIQCRRRSNMKMSSIIFAPNLASLLLLKYVTILPRRSSLTSLSMPKMEVKADSYMLGKRTANIKSKLQLATRSTQKRPLMQFRVILLGSSTRTSVLGSMQQLLKLITISKMKQKSITQSEYSQPILSLKAPGKANASGIWMAFQIERIMTKMSHLILNLSFGLNMNLAQRLLQFLLAFQNSVRSKSSSSTASFLSRIIVPDSSLDSWKVFFSYPLVWNIELFIRGRASCDSLWESWQSILFPLVFINGRQPLFLSPPDGWLISDLTGAESRSEFRALLMRMGSFRLQDWSC